MRSIRRCGGAMGRDALLGVAGYWAALLLRFDGNVPPLYAGHLSALLVPIAVILLVAGSATGMYRSVSRYTSIADLLRLGCAVGVTSLALLGVALLPPGGAHYLPLSVPIIAFPIVLVALGSARVASRIRASYHSGRWTDADRVLIIGAGDAGEIAARDMLREAALKLNPVGFLDDDPSRRGQRIHGVPVLGRVSDLENVVRRIRPDHVLIAMPEVPTRNVRPILHRVVATGVNAKILPSLREVIGGGPEAAPVIRDVDIADLIGREPVRIDHAEIARCVQDRVVLVTGAAGSIGGELARQTLRFRPARLVILDNNETDLFYLWQELDSHRAEGCAVEMVVGDIRDRRRIDHALSNQRPHLVLHAAAYKHVPVMEAQAAEAVKTNVMGTRFLAEAAAKHGAERFILVSSDKAVRPTSVMGASKRLAEMVVSRVGGNARTIFAAVRFGNVLGSRGSVVPIFAKQISEGGPITVTHPEASRYFMTIEEASALILQAAAIATGGETFVLDMQEPVRIVDLAERMRDLLARDHDEIEIVFTGLRPGEKLHEDLWQTDELLGVTTHPRILRAVVQDGRHRNDQGNGRGHGQEAGNGSGDLADGALRTLEELAIWNAEPDEIRRHLFSIANHVPNAVVLTDSMMSDLASSQNGWQQAYGTFAEARRTTVTTDVPTVPSGTAER